MICLINISNRSRLQNSLGRNLNDEQNINQYFGDHHPGIKQAHLYRSEIDL